MKLPSVDEIARVIDPGAFREGDVGGLRKIKRKQARHIAMRVLDRIKEGRATDEIERLREGLIQERFDLGVTGMRRTLDAGFDDATAFRVGLIEAGFLPNVPAPPLPKEGEA